MALGAERYSGERGRKQFFDLSEANSFQAIPWYSIPFDPLGLWRCPQQIPCPDTFDLELHATAWLREAA
jgi:hypothetical protein